MKKFLSLLLYILCTIVPALAQEEPAAPPATLSSSAWLMNVVIIVFIFAAVTMLIVALVLLRTFKVLAKELKHPSPLYQPTAQKPMEYEDWLQAKKAKPGFFTRVLGLRPLSEEKDLLMEHEFDGIAELDNPTPSWFMWLFYASIFFAAAYLLNYHVFHWGKLQDEEYVIEMKEAAAAKEAYLATVANKIDENTVKVETDPAIISAGAKVFSTNCVACHGDKGQGIVGPNLTDDYWLHGGKVNSVFKTIKYGVPDKGMISWEKTLTPKQISEVANFILSLKGTNPPGAKEAQGEKES